jgi:hypothetical protein
MSGTPFRASVPKLLPSTVRSRKRGNRAQANATSSPRSAFVHANPVSHLVDAEHGLITGHSHRADHPVPLVSAALLAVLAPLTAWLYGGYQ